MTDLSHLRRVAEAARKEREQNGGYIIESPADREFREAIDDPALVSLLLDVAKTLERLIEAASEFAVSAVVGAAELMDEDEDKLNIALNDARRALATLAAATPEASDD